MNPYIKAYIDAAQKNKIDYIYHDPIECVEILLGKNTYYFWHRYNTLSPASNLVLAHKRYPQNIVLQRAQIPVQPVILLKKDLVTKDKIPNIPFDYPLTAKPNEIGFNNRLSVYNIQNETMLSEVTDQIFDYTEELIIEPFYPGLKTYRVLLYGGKIYSIVEMVPPSVVGDGVRTVNQLMELENENRGALSQFVHVGFLYPDSDYIFTLKNQNLTLESIPAADDIVLLSNNPDITSGSVSHHIDINLLNPELKNIILKAAHILNLGILEFEIQCQDISSINLKDNKHLINISQIPDIVVHQEPMHGVGVPISAIILRDLKKKHLLSYYKQKIFKSA